MKSMGRIAGLVAMLALVAGCSSVPVATAPPVNSSPWAAVSIASDAGSAAATASGWQHHVFPGKSPTQFKYARKGGRDAVAALASSSASALRNRVRVEPAGLGRVRFSWLVPQLIAGADMALREADDSPVRVVLVFEGDRTRFSARDAMLSELVHALTGEQMPYATLMYVWSNRRPPESLIASPRTDRVRKLVLESGGARLDRWLDYDRDIAGDFRRAFGEAPGALVGIGIMTDSDNTRSEARAWYGPLSLRPPSQRLAAD